MPFVTAVKKHKSLSMRKGISARPEMEENHKGGENSRQLKSVPASRRGVVSDLLECVCSK